MKCKNCRNLVHNKDNGTYPWCPIFDDSMDVEAERTCTEYETMSQADRIRNMTDEELAEFFDSGLRSVCLDFHCEECDNALNCDVCYLEWLKSEVKE